jgi:hypothetical protein
MVAEGVGGVLEVVSCVFKIAAKLTAGPFSRLWRVEQSNSCACGDSHHKSCPDLNCIHENVPFPTMFTVYPL